MKCDDVEMNQYQYSIFFLLKHGIVQVQHSQNSPNQDLWDVFDFLYWFGLAGLIAYNPL